MSGSLEVAPVGRSARISSLRLVAGGEGVLADYRTHRLAEMVRARGWDQAVLHRCALDGQWATAALVLKSPGNVGFLFFAPPPSSQRLWPAAVAAVRSATEAALADGLSLVQAMTDPGATAEDALLREAGLGRLTELVYMRLSLQEWSAPPEAPALAIRRWGQFTEEELRNVIAGTYQQSLDCPALARVRDIPEVIETHRASGVFRPGSWWLVDCDGQAAACILANAVPHARDWDVAYLGVRPEFRGRGLGGRMLRRMLREARGGGMQGVTLAVDAANPYAQRLYDAEGFREQQRRVAYVRLRACEGPVTAAHTAC